MEKTFKRSYELKETTIRKLEEMKLFAYPLGTDLKDIVEDAICLLYQNKIGKVNNLPPK